nr:hypothetical protein [uncultured Campylobacter sp.]
MGKFKISFYAGWLLHERLKFEIPPSHKRVKFKISSRAIAIKFYPSQRGILSTINPTSRQFYSFVNYLRNFKFHPTTTLYNQHCIKFRSFLKFYRLKILKYRQI